jgi:hypothetical protein
MSLARVKRDGQSCLILNRDYGNTTLTSVFLFYEILDATLVCVVLVVLCVSQRMRE